MSAPVSMFMETKFRVASDVAVFKNSKILFSAQDTFVEPPRGKVRNIKGGVSACIHFRLNKATLTSGQRHELSSSSCRQ